ncbi:hypothetical protein BHE90_014109 [Fusarium euwallaceae]|uniref:Integral membrane protein n=1 Tax=Fusarium euwallaceae TaxID=1147111 RepID=A0A430L6W4_9HYPO|nr:hypothetical protein BHE90_014109 [Fusarium euwallaceae]
MKRPQDHFVGRHYDAEHSTGPLKFLNPTKRYMVAGKRQVTAPEVERDQLPPSGRVPKVAYVWRSRDNRKGRHALAVDVDPHKYEKTKSPKPTNTLNRTMRGIAKMFLRYPVWDVSYDVAVIFTIGSIIWVVNGFFSWLPVQDPSSEFSGETDWAAGLTALVGATVFEVGSVLLMLEAVNENRSDCFGWAVEESVDGVLHLKTVHECRHSHAQKRTFVAGKSINEHQVDESPTEDGRFLACSAQMFGATVFWISGFTALPPILKNLSTPALNGVYWLPQVIGGTGFIVSSTLFMLEVQPRWYIPAPGVLGWHIGLWNLIGAIGFTLCGALGFGMNQPGVEYALTLSTFIGSWAFLIGSAVQWFESLNKYPIWVEHKVRRLERQSD